VEVPVFFVGVLVFELLPSMSFLDLRLEFATSVRSKYWYNLLYTRGGIGGRGSIGGRSSVVFNLFTHQLAHLDNVEAKNSTSRKQYLHKHMPFQSPLLLSMYWLSFGTELGASAQAR
jgi:hypothetical protein